MWPQPAPADRQAGAGHNQSAGASQRLAWPSGSGPHTNMIQNRKAAVEMLESAGYSPEIDPWGDITIEMDGGRIWVHIWARSEYPRGPRRVRIANVCATGKCPIHERRPRLWRLPGACSMSSPGLRRLRPSQPAHWRALLSGQPPPAGARSQCAGQKAVSPDLLSTAAGRIGQIRP
jgi:hypothetical protein